MDDEENYDHRESNTFIYRFLRDKKKRKILFIYGTNCLSFMFSMIALIIVSSVEKTKNINNNDYINIFIRRNDGLNVDATERDSFGNIIVYNDDKKEEMVINYDITISMEQLSLFNKSNNNKIGNNDSSEIRIIGILKWKNNHNIYHDNNNHFSTFLCKNKNKLNSNEYALCIKNE